MLFLAALVVMAWSGLARGQAVTFQPSITSSQETQQPPATTPVTPRGTIALTGRNCTQTVTLTPPFYQVQDFRVMQEPGIRCVITFTVDDSSTWRPLSGAVSPYGMAAYPSARRYGRVPQDKISLKKRSKSLYGIPKPPFAEKTIFRSTKAPARESKNYPSSPLFWPFVESTIQYSTPTHQETIWSNEVNPVASSRIPTDSHPFSSPEEQNENYFQSQEEKRQLTLKYHETSDPKSHYPNEVYVKTQSYPSSSYSADWAQPLQKINSPYSYHGPSNSNMWPTNPHKASGTYSAKWASQTYKPYGVYYSWPPVAWWWPPYRNPWYSLPPPPPPRPRLLLELKDIDVTPGVFDCEYGAVRVYSVSSGLPSLVRSVCGSNTSTAVLPEDGIAIVTYTSTEEVAVGTGFTVSVQTIQTSSPFNIASQTNVPSAVQYARKIRTQAAKNFEGPPSYPLLSQSTSQFSDKRLDSNINTKPFNEVEFYPGGYYYEKDCNHTIWKGRLFLPYR